MRVGREAGVRASGQDQGGDGARPTSPTPEREVRPLVRGARGGTEPTLRRKAREPFRSSSLIPRPSPPGWIIFASWGETVFGHPPKDRGERPRGSSESRPLWMNDLRGREVYVTSAQDSWGPQVASWPLGCAAWLVGVWQEAHFSWPALGPTSPQLPGEAR